MELIEPKFKQFSLNELWQKTPMDIREVWAGYMDHVERIKEKNLPQIHKINDQLQDIKGKRKKEFVQQRKELNKQKTIWEDQPSCLSAIYERHLIDLQNQFLEDAQKKALEEGLPDENEIKENFILTLSEEISDTRPYIEYNYDKTYEQIYKTVLNDHIKQQKNDKIPTEKFAIYNIGEMFGVRENMKNSTGFGDPVFKSKPEAKQYVQERQHLIKANQAAHEKQKRIEEEQKKTENKKNKIRAEIRVKSKVKIDPKLFEALLPQIAGRVKKFLNKEIDFADMGVVTWRDVIESGKYVRKEQVTVPVIKYNRRKYNRMGAAEQAVYEKRLKETKSEWHLVTKDNAFISIPKSVFQVISVEAPQQEQIITWIDTKQNGFQVFIAINEKDQSVFHIDGKNVSGKIKNILQNNGFDQINKNIFEAPITLSSSFCLWNLPNTQKIKIPISDIKFHFKENDEVTVQNEDNENFMPTSGPEV